MCVEKGREEKRKEEQLKHWSTTHCSRMHRDFHIAQQESRAEQSKAEYTNFTHVGPKEHTIFHQKRSKVFQCERPVCVCTKFLYFYLLFRCFSQKRRILHAQWNEHQPTNWHLTNFLCFNHSNFRIFFFCSFCNCCCNPFLCAVWSMRDILHAIKKAIIEATAEEEDGKKHDKLFQNEKEHTTQHTDTQTWREVRKNQRVQRNQPKKRVKIAVCVAWMSSLCLFLPLEMQIVQVLCKQQINNIANRYLISFTRLSETTFFHACDSRIIIIHIVLFICMSMQENHHTIGSRFVTMVRWRSHRQRCCCCYGFRGAFIVVMVAGKYVSVMVWAAQLIIFFFASLIIWLWQTKWWKWNKKHQQTINVRTVIHTHTAC